MTDIEYEKDGICKFAQERFKNDLIDAGWKVVEKETEITVNQFEPQKKRGRKAKVK